MSKMMPHSEKKTSCPRCGYDQRGVVESWTDCCPLPGICSECGLEFEWADLLSPRRRPPGWLFEYAPGGMKLAWAFVLTVLSLLNPWFFWRRLSMSFLIKWRRIALLLGIILALEYLMFAVSSAHVAGFIWKEYNPSSNTLPRPSGLTLLSTYPEAVARGLFIPYSQEAFIRITGGGMTWGVMPQPWFKLTWREQDEAFFYLVLFVILLPGVFLVLPVTRKRAKVKWDHIGRIFAYSLIIPALLMMFIIYQAWVAYTGSGTIQSRPQWMYIARCHWATVIAFPQMGLFWSVAISRHLRIDQAWKVALSITLLAFMLATVFMYLTNTALIETLVSRIIFPFGA